MRGVEKVYGRLRRMGAVLLICAAICAGVSAEEKVLAAKQVDVYLLIGQSNMAGRGKITEEYKDKPLAGTALLDKKGRWIPAKVPLNLYSTVRKNVGMQQVNPGVGFAIAMHETQPDVILGLVVNARGGTSIDEWMPGKNLYKQAVARAKLALKSGGVLKGILWHQGEANSKDPEYIKKAARLIGALRKDLGNEKLPFVAGQITQKQEYLFNKLILTLPQKVKFTAVVSSDGLVATDRWHFDTASQIELGKRYAAKMLQLQKEAAEKAKDK